MSPPGIFSDGVRQRDWNMKDLPPFSARLMPEFSQRRSIKDMFAKPKASIQPAEPAQPSPKPPTSTNSPSAGPTSQSAAAFPTAVSPSKATAASSPDRKRKASDVAVPQVTKKQKPTTASTSKTAPAKGQKSLKGFFQPKSKPAPEVVEDEENDTAANGVSAAAIEQSSNGIDESVDKAVGPNDIPAAHSSKPSTAKGGANGPDSPATTKTPAKSDTLHSLEDDDEMVYDPIVNKESWQSLFKKPIAPLCEGHEEPCKSMQTKKKGENQGRSFWMCARPLGPSGAKEKNTQWRCPTFIWCSDWKAGDTR